MQHTPQLSSIETQTRLGQVLSQYEAIVLSPNPNERYAANVFLDQLIAPCSQLLGIAQKSAASAPKKKAFDAVQMQLETSRGSRFEIEQVLSAKEQLKDGSNKAMAELIIKIRALLLSQPVQKNSRDMVENTQPIADTRKLLQQLQETDAELVKLGINV